MNNTNNIVRVKNTHSRSGMVSLLILAAISSISGVVMTVPSVAYAQDSYVQDCLTLGGNGGGGGIGGTSGDSSGGASGDGGGGGSGGTGGTGPTGSSGGNAGNGGETAQGGNGGETLAGGGGTGGGGGTSRLTCVMVAPVLSVNPTISVPPESFEPRP